MDERFNYKKEDTNDPSFIGIFCATCDQEIGYEDCPDCDADKEEKSASNGTEEKDDEYVLHSVGERTVKIDEITLLDSGESDSDFWNNFNWDWKSPDDVKNFVDVALKRGVYEYAWGDLEPLGTENFYTIWWCQVQDAIKHMAQNFSEADLKSSITHLLEGEFDECDPSIFDALLKHVPGFPQKYPEINGYVENIMPEDWFSDWWEFSWYPFIQRYLTWTFWGPETMARSVHVDSVYLKRIFNNSIKAENPYRTFRARVALALNPNCPKEILEFLWDNRNSENWLLRDREEENVISYSAGKYVIDGNHSSIQAIRDEASLTLEFRFDTDERWDSGPGAEYVENILDIQWEADNAKNCLLAAFAKNTNLSAAQYDDLSKENHPLVRYFLSKNSNLQNELKMAFTLESPTFTFTPYSGDNDDVTLR